MAKAAHRYKGRKITGRFLAIPHDVLTCPAFSELSAQAVKLLLDIASQDRGNNNGDFSVAWKVMKLRGWRSEATLAHAKRMLIDKGFLYETRKGRLPNTCSLYAVTWYPLDMCDKFDVGALAGFNAKGYMPKLVVMNSKPVRDWTLPNGGIDPMQNSGLATDAVARRSA